MNVIEAQGFKIDMGPTMLMMPEVIEKMFTACGRDMRDYLCLQRLTPAYRICWPDGTTLDMGSSAQEMMAQARAFAPEDADRLPGLIAGMEAKYANARPQLHRAAVSTLLADMVRPSTLRGLVKALPLESVYKFVSKHIRSEKLRQAFTFQDALPGYEPLRLPLHLRPVALYRDGVRRVVFPKAAPSLWPMRWSGYCASWGGELHYCRPVERIMLDGKRATGVRTADGAEWRADVVVCNMDVPMAYKKLLPPEIRRKHTDARLERHDYGCSGYLLYLGVKKIRSNWGHNMIVLSDDYEGILDDICRKKRLPRDPAMHVCIPTRTDPSLAPEGHDVVYVLVPCPNTQCDIGPGSARGRYCATVYWPSLRRRACPACARISSTRRALYATGFRVALWFATRARPTAG